MAIRKYLTEFGLNMFGTYKVLLQQDHLNRLENGGFDSTHPCHIYMVMRRPRIMLDPDSIKFEEKTVSGVFNIQKGNSLESHTFSVPFLALKNISKRWTMPIKNWSAAMNQFAILFDGRVPMGGLNQNSLTQSA
jgi:hypothetical protein